MPALLDQHGQPMRALPAAAPNQGARADYGMGVPGPGRAFAYKAAEIQSQELGLDFFPGIRSPDAEYSLHRNRIVSRSRDIVRNDGFLHGGIDRILDNTVGASLRLNSMPDHRWLASQGCKVDDVWADLFRRKAEAIWRVWSESPGNYNDVSRQLSWGQQTRLGLRHKLIDGENTSLIYWLPERIGRGMSHYATAVLLVDPDRLSNPMEVMDTLYLRGGVEIDDYGAPLAYHFREAHQNDWFGTAKSMLWERVEREDDDGWQRVIHDFDRDRTGQNRGIGVFTAVLSHAKMLSKYYGVELQAATIASILGFFVTSAQDPALTEEALGGGNGDDAYGDMLSLRKDFYDEHPVRMNGVRVPILSPGDDVKSVSAAHPNAGFNQFHREMQRSIASAIGVTTEQLAGTWSEMNYSSARASYLEIWKTMDRRTTEYTSTSINPVYASVLREAMENGQFDDINPTGMPDFIDARAAYTRCMWTGPGRGMIDPVKEAQGSALALDTGLTTLAMECSKQGLDWEDVLEQRARENQKFKDLGISKPEWLASIAATQVAEPEEKPQAQ